MDYTSLVAAIGIALYGVIEYRRRETSHARSIAEVRRGLRPHFELPHVALWQVVTSFSVGALLVAFIVLLLALEFRTGVKAGPYIPLVLTFSVLLLVVALIAVRTLVSYIWWRDRR
jgi:hypothetical protein